MQFVLVSLADGVGEDVHAERGVVLMLGECYARLVESGHLSFSCLYSATCSGLVSVIPCAFACSSSHAASDGRHAPLTPERSSLTWPRVPFRRSATVYASRPSGKARRSRTHTTYRPSHSSIVHQHRFSCAGEENLTLTPRVSKSGSFPRRDAAGSARKAGMRTGRPRSTNRTGRTSPIRLRRRSGRRRGRRTPDR